VEKLYPTAGHSSISLCLRAYIRDFMVLQADVRSRSSYFCYDVSVGRYH